MTRLILATPGVGKSYLDRHYTNVYDFDKHSLDYKYDRTGFESFTDEEFKGIPGRKIKDNWEDQYVKDLFEIVDSGNYHVVTAWIHEAILNHAKEHGYDLEIICYDPSYSRKDIRERLVKRGNNNQYITNAMEWIERVADTYRPYGFKMVYLRKGYLRDYLLKTGTKLHHGSGEIETYITIAKEMIRQKLPMLSETLLGLYTLLVVSKIRISNETVHNAWSLSIESFHKSLLPYENLTKEVQDLDSPYRDVLIAIQKDFHLSHDVIPSDKEIEDILQCFT